MGMFRKASKSRARLRAAIVGPSGAGKSYTSLKLGSFLGGRIAVIDTEHGSASKYAHLFDFDVVELANYDPRNYMEALAAAEKEGYAVCVIDSLSHAWSGKGGALEMVDNAAKRSQSGNKFTAWRDVTPLHNALVDAILTSGCHVIATMRAHTEYVMEADSRGKMVPRKIGLAPVQRQGMEYEFDLVGDITLDHDLLISKTRCEELDQAVIHKPGKELAEVLIRWLSDGYEPPSEGDGGGEDAAGTNGSPADTGRPVDPPVDPPADPPAALGSLDPETLAELIECRDKALKYEIITDYQWRDALARRGVGDPSKLNKQQAVQLIVRLNERIDSKEWSPLGRPDPIVEKVREEEAARQEDAASTKGENLAEAAEDLREINDHLRESLGETKAEDYMLPDAKRPARKPGRPKKSD